VWSYRVSVYLRSDILKNKPIRTKTYYTRIKNNDPIVGGGNKFVQGVIMGYLECICGGEEYQSMVGARPIITLLVDKKTGDHIYSIITTHDLYQKFVEITETGYPGVCEFDIFD
jgi:hypothetical protein